MFREIYMELFIVLDFHKKTSSYYSVLYKYNKNTYPQK